MVGSRRWLLLLLLTVLADLPACDQSLEIGRMFAPSIDAGASVSDVGSAADAGVAIADSGAPDAMEAPDAGILWFSGFETGDTSEWSAGGASAGGENDHLVTASVSPQPAHGGAQAWHISFDTADKVDHGAQVYRRVESGPAYYGAWFLIDQPHTPTTFWTVFSFFYEDQAGNSQARHGLWDLNLNSQIVYFYNEITKQFQDASPRQSYLVGQWFHLEARFAYEAGHIGHLTVWLDGVQILDLSNLAAAPTDYLYWAVGSETDSLAPTACTVSIDDATISTGRIGP
ncbi:MAG TPA: hypothetical protein VGL59_04950 [Polyangia bacterium]|jgi:hypothetical protein